MSYKVDTQDKYIVIGATRTGINLIKKLHALAVPALLVDTKQCPEREIQNIYQQMETLEDAVMLAGKCYFVTFDEDSANIKLCLALNKLHSNIALYTMLAQESLGDKIALCLPNFHYINPAKKSAVKFIKAALDDLEYRPVENFKWAKIIIKFDFLIKKAMLFIGTIMTTSTLFFHFYDGLAWIDSFYFTVTMMATVGFGDYSLKDHSDLSKLVGSFIMLLSITGTAIIFALVSDSIIRKRKELSMGISRYKGHGHIIVVGGGSVGFNIVKLLTAMKEPTVILDKTLDGKYSQQIVDLGVPYLIGNAEDEANLYRAGLGCCKAIICATHDDLINLEICLNAKIARPDLRIVVRMYDQNLAANLNESIAINSLSMSFIAADEFIKMLSADIGG